MLSVTIKHLLRTYHPLDTSELISNPYATGGLRIQTKIIDKDKHDASTIKMRGIHDPIPRSEFLGELSPSDPLFEFFEKLRPSNSSSFKYLLRITSTLRKQVER